MLPPNRRWEELFSDVYIKKDGLLIDLSGETSILLLMSKAAHRMSGLPVGNREKAIKEHHSKHGVFTAFAGF